MANDKVKIAKSKLVALGEAIRTKTGSTDEYRLTDIPAITTEIVNKLTSITFTLPTKDYTAGDALDLTGTSVIAHYSHASDKNVTSVATISPTGGSLLVVGNNTITASYTEKGITKTASVVVNAKMAIATWADGTWDEIADALNKHRNGEVDLYTTPGWEIGRAKTVSLTSMAATGVGETHVAQDVEMVLMDKNVVNLAAGGKCNFVIGMRNCLSNGTTAETGYINSSQTNNGGWNSSARRTWCNNVFANAVPTGLKNLVKNASIKTSAGNGSSTLNTTSDKWFLPCEYNVLGTNKSSASGEDAIQWEFYKSSGNRRKLIGKTGNSADWWLRSPIPTGMFSTRGGWTKYNPTGGVESAYANANYGLAPHACI